MTTPISLQHRLWYYIVIGSSAAAVNIVLVFLQVHFWHINPLLANIWAFLCAFLISYFGHKYYTFARLQDQKQLSLPHFFVVAASACLLNEILYFLLLRFTNLHYLLALILVLSVVATYNFIVARYWACR